MSNYNKQHVLMQNSVFQLINHDLAEILPIRRKTLNIIFMAFSIIVWIPTVKKHYLSKPHKIPGPHWKQLHCVLCVGTVSTRRSKSMVNKGLQNYSISRIVSESEI